MAILSLGNNGETDPTKWNRVKIKAYVGTGSSVKNVVEYETQWKTLFKRIFCVRYT